MSTKTQKRFLKTVVEHGQTLNVYTESGLFTIDTISAFGATGCIIVPNGYALTRLKGGTAYAIVKES